MIFKIGRAIFIVAAVLTALSMAACTQKASDTATPSGQVSPTATSSGGQTSTPFGSAVPHATNTPSIGGATVTPSIANPTPTPRATGAPTPVAATDGFSLYMGARLVAADGTALGELVPVSESFDSVCNKDGSFGSPFSPTSIFNQDSEYGGSFGSQSPFNADSTQPPAIVLGSETLGRLTVSPFVANPVNAEEFLTWLGCYREAG